MVSVTELSPMDPLPDGEGWVSAAGLAAAGAELDAFLAWDEEQIRRDHGREGRPDVVAATLAKNYSSTATVAHDDHLRRVQRRRPRAGAPACGDARVMRTDHFY